MSSRFTRNLSEVKDVNKLAEHVTTQNDLVQTTEGDVFVVTKKGFQKITGGVDSSDLDKINNDVDKSKTDITNLKSEQTKIKKSVSDLEKSNETLTTKVSDLEKSNKDLTSRIEALENPETTE